MYPTDVSCALLHEVRVVRYDRRVKPRLDSEQAWISVVAEIARMPGVPRQLMGEHHPTADNLCAACTTPGRGTPRTEWPCVLYLLGNAALDHLIALRDPGWLSGTCAAGADELTRRREDRHRPTRLGIHRRT
jgi:hypothetical protein